MLFGQPYHTGGGDPLCHCARHTAQACEATATTYVVLGVAVAMAEGSVDVA